MNLAGWLFPKNNERFKVVDANLALALHYTMLGAIVGHLLFIFMFLWLGVKEMAWLNIFSCAIYFCCLLIIQSGHTSTALLIGIFEVSIHAILSVVLVGWESGFHYYILVLIPLIFFSQVWRIPLKLALSSALCGLYISIHFYALATPPLIASDANHLQLIDTFNIIALFIFFSLLAYFYYLAATRAEIALKNANLGLKFQARYDALTHLPNRRELTEQLETLASTYLIGANPFCVIIADIDNFKKYNDTYGHNMGDAILVKAAEALKSCMREYDIVGRWGGEEFLALLPDTSISGGQMAAERMREKIEALRATINGIESPITMTFGVSEFGNEINLLGCIERADQAMYRGKLIGKNCVVIQPGDGLPRP